MGCFDSTCALTRVAVHHGEPVYAVLWRPHKEVFSDKTYEPQRSTYKLLVDVLRKEASWREEYRYMPYDDRPKEWGVWAKYVTLYHGAYDDYGWIEGVDRPEGIPRHSEWYFFAHERVVHKICKVYEDVPLDGDPLEIVKAIAVFAYKTRTPLFAQDWLLGEQYGTYRERFDQRLLLEMTKELLDYKDEEYGY